MTKRDAQGEVKPAVASRVCVLGGGAFGTAMAQHLAVKGSQVTMWALEQEVIDSVNNQHENPAYLPGFKLSERLVATLSVEEAVEGAEMVLLIIPTPFIASWIHENQRKLPWTVPLVCCSKGIEESTLRTPYEILVDELPGKYHNQLCVLSGPSFAKEIAGGLPTNATCAAKCSEVAYRVQSLVSTKSFRAYSASDVVGAELCGAVKNVLAIACGASDGLGFGDNARAALITRGLAEMARLIVKKGGRATTINGLAGVGDLVLTCSSKLSRNYSVGYSLAQGKPIDSGKAVAEGVKTSLALHILADQLGVNMPICESVHKVIHAGVPLKNVLASLQGRSLKSEDEDATLQSAS
eukprot:CAMPEP_0176079202 /NCGR_PEP_ID=MMETSP0120_2-20121206/39612_1 /TAXON_ID=160619 /ORGANISM="Kryptoperidinium foliaceum, Strain CCMP 1326" /LENGTH=352 /DNA_ID=CAMNT_0017412957 /DNA_START=42 /DNA_END=1100 /DNA_ORIENTATION=+